MYDADHPIHSRLPLTIARGLEGEPTSYSVKLAGVELGWHLGRDGVKIEFEECAGASEPTITLKFYGDAVGLDLDADLIAYLREKDAQEQKPRITNHAAGCKDPSRCPGCR